MNNQFTICIPTKNRPNVLLKLLEVIYDDSLAFAITIEKDEKDLYYEVMQRYSHINYIIVPNNCGTGFVRKILADYSILKKDKFTLYIDDNVKISLENLPQFIDIMKKNPHIYWLSGFGAFWGLIYGSKGDLLFPVHRFGGCFFGIRTDCLKQENWDPNMIMMEDTELCIRYIKKFDDNIKHLYIYRGIFFRKKRGQKGGAFNLTKRKDVIDGMSNYINEKYGEILVVPQWIGMKNKKYHKRVSWKKVYGDKPFKEQKEVKTK